MELVPNAPGFPSIQPISRNAGSTPVPPPYLHLAQRHHRLYTMSGSSAGGGSGCPDWTLGGPPRALLPVREAASCGSVPRRPPPTLFTVFQQDDSDSSSRWANGGPGRRDRQPSSSSSNSGGEGRAMTRAGRSGQQLPANPPSLHGSRYNSPRARVVGSRAGRSELDRLRAYVRTQSRDHCRHACSNWNSPATVPDGQASCNPTSRSVHIPCTPARLYTCT